ncbi:MAG: aminotransferase class I/II-fold pyridoxal phosphate-dependent enzyme [Clostridiales bacterium]|jgi:threonine-phosphate decarboxylase|nr:aminotransferase class I/II-fold pyridoxal phosphate-dependent enzyme [Clostridiales bacterium]
MAFTHGGDLYAIERAFGTPKEDIMDFSGNINPLGVPQSVIKAVKESASDVTRYPDPEYAELREAISKYAGVDAGGVIVGAGSTELISLYIRAVFRLERNRKKAVILCPAYSEYKREADNCGVESVLFPLKEENEFRAGMELLDAIDERTGVLIAANPNNPTGAAIERGQMTEIVEHCARLGVRVMIDETYAEFAEKDIITADLTRKFENLFTVRGVSKFFAAPGLRLGYAMCFDKAVLDEIKRIKDPWSVNTLAEAAGKVMFSDSEHINASKKLVFAERAKLISVLSSWPEIKVYDSQANFILIRLKENCLLTSTKIFEKMIARRALVRDCRSFQFLGDRFLRFCALGPKENDMLLSALEGVIRRGE